MEELAEGLALSGRYLLGPVVGHGAMGQVHLAEDLRLARPVAVKSLRPELARYPDVRQRFGQEARSAARINHPNVVRVYDSGEEGRIPYLVMECLPGSTLVDELAWGTLEPRRARRVGLDVLGALDAAHHMGVVHRDVKPGNILLTAAPDGPVKVSDFGIAKSADDHSLTDSGGLVGTAAYLAPERVAGEPATPVSDLYSLGVVLYEALAGRKPYEGETSLAIALAIHMGGAPSLHDLRPDLDPALAAVIDRAIARDVSERWGSAAAMAVALRAWRPAAGLPDVGADTGAVVIAPTGRPTVSLLGPPLVGEPGGVGAAPGTDLAGGDEPTALFEAEPAVAVSGGEDGEGDGDRTRSLALEQDGGDTRAMPAPWSDGDDLAEPSAREGEGSGGTPSAAGVASSPALGEHGDDDGGEPTQLLEPGGRSAAAPAWGAARAAGAGSSTALAASRGAGAREEPDSHREPAGDDRRTRRRRTLAVSGAAAAAALLLITALVAMTGSGDGQPPDPATPTTTAELVAGPSSILPPPEVSTVAPARSVVPATTRPPRRPVAPATTAVPLPTTTQPAPTTTAAPPVRPTTVPVATTVPPTTATTAPPAPAAPAV